MSMLYGLNDLPLEKQEEDTLGLSPYVKGLAHFIRNCPAPMSIALQGDWGTGKTSLIFQLQDELRHGDEPVKCVYFNTWQYSQFNMAQDLYTSFIRNLADKLCVDNKTAETQKKAMLNTLKFLSFHFTKQLSGIDPKELIDAVKTKEDRDHAVERLRSEFAALVASAVHSKQERLVVFIDDLDRLRPDIAVELLEVIKLFLDVPHCIFVLAVDYNVVVSGVRKKFGSDLSEEKCRAFFDKIIQLPFRMPVEAYDLPSMVGSALGDYLHTDHIPYVSTVIGATIGTNPRAFKRLANSFFLIHSVLKFQPDAEIDVDEKTRNALLFCALAVQLALPHVYSALLTLPDSLDERIAQLFSIFVADDISFHNIKGSANDFLLALDDGLPAATHIRMLDFDSEEIRHRYLDHAGISALMEKREWQILVPAISALDNALQNILSAHGDGCYELFADAVALSSITNAKSHPSSPN